MNRVSLNGVEVMPFSSEDELFNYIERKKGILVAINAEKILHATDQTRKIINRNIGYVDGSGVMIALHKKGFKNACRIPGCELWLKIIKHFQKDHSFYLIGSKPEIIQETVNKLKVSFPNLNIVGYHDGYISSDEIKNELIEDILRKKPDVIFVAMGSPKQELFMEEIQKQHKAIYQGLGGSFDVYTGHVKRAPKWWCDHNLEFAYRLIKQPSRIKRQIHLIKYGWWLLAHKL